MKIRSQFVSNSSSTSFVVIGQGKLLDLQFFTRIDSDIFVIGEAGCCEFGWDNVKYDDLYSRINFAWLQAYYVNTDHENKWIEYCKKDKFRGYEKSIEYAEDRKSKCRDNWMEMLYAAVKEFFQVENVECILSPEFCCKKNNQRYGYIDHQSASHEGQNTEIFDSMDSLRQFLFCDNSYIQGGNDNE